MLRKTRFLYGMRHNTRFMSSAVPRIMPSHSYAPITSDVTEHRDTHDDLITQVLTKSDAKRVLNVLYKYPNAYWACDTETTGLDIKSQGPVGNGAVTCISIYGGPDIDFGDGPGSALWIENIDKSAGLIQEFKQWFEDEKYKKVWHNYGFDRHVMFNEGVDCKGFGGDTMHMARLWNTALDTDFGGVEGNRGYSLAALTNRLCAEKFAKISMKEIFGEAKPLKSGGAGKVMEIPDSLVLQRSPLHRDKWIKYSARDVVSTWHVREILEEKLREQDWIVDGRRLGDMQDFYNMYFCRFGELLTDMERNGIKVDTKKHVKDAEERARVDRKQMEAIFHDWAAKHTPNGRLINAASSTQIQHFLFGKFEKKERISSTRTFQLNKTEEELAKDIEEFEVVNKYGGKRVAELRELLKARGLQVVGKKADLVARLLESDGALAPPARDIQNNANKGDAVSSEAIEWADFDEYELRDICNARGISDCGNLYQLRERLEADSKQKIQSIISIKPPKKQTEITIQSLCLDPISFTPAGCPMVSSAILKELSGSELFGDEKDAVWGPLFQKFHGEETGKEACRAVGALARIGQIDTMITNFLVPLQALVDKNGRIHCSLNLNTETGRLSSRKPNLQNQPALEKDQYKIRDAFVAEEGKTFIVADYGQLELRLLAHITQCKSMIDAFASGGCFHSRTAMGMYPHIREAVEKGDVLLEWDYSQGPCPKPLVKDVYASERRKAKTLNFSIAYGKTVHGLAKDWGITKEEAEKVLEAWYADRPEVKKWQEKTRNFAKNNLHVETLMGRRRDLPYARTRGAPGAHSLRAAINTPIQGSAADVVMMAMIKLWESEKLKSLGWKLLLQIHDEVILEGPKETKDEAMKEVMECMENPFDDFALSKLSVHLDVDAKSADSWYKAK